MNRQTEDSCFATLVSGTSAKPIVGIFFKARPTMTFLVHRLGAFLGIHKKVSDT